MQIRTRLTLQFMSTGVIIMVIASAAIYYFSSGYRQEDFYERLQNKAVTTTKLLIEVEEVDISLLRRIERDNPMSLPKEKIIILNYHNEILYSSDEENVIRYDQDLLDRIRLNGNVRFRQDEFEALGFLFADKYDRFVVIAAASDIFGYKKLQNLRTILVIVSVTSMVLFLIAGLFYSGRALQPIARVIEQVDDISISSLDLRVDEGNGQDEIARLALTFNKMLERLESAFKVQKNFIANASHEIRTPLTAITGQLEVVLLRERNREQYEEAIQSALEDIKNLTNITNRLLLLAQASSEVQELNFTPVRVDETLWSSREEILRRNTKNQVKIILDDTIKEENNLIVKGDFQLLKTAMINLLDNACKYSLDHISNVTVSSKNGQLIVEISDNGIGISEEDIPHIFEPFHRGHNSHNVRGHGIGLSLVERIVRLHQGNISVESILGQGSRFTVSIPQNEL